MNNRRRASRNDESRVARGSEPQRGNGLRRGHAPQSENLKVRNNVGRDTERIQPSPKNTIDWPAGNELMSYPVDVLRRFRHDMDRFFGDLGSMRIGDRMSVWSPRTEMFDREGKMIVRMELPGLVKEDVKISVTHDSLIIEGERRRDEEKRGHGYFESEWSYGRFHREIPLPETVEASDVKATFANGVLEIDLPQPKNVRERREVPIR